MSARPADALLRISCLFALAALPLGCSAHRHEEVVATPSPAHAPQSCAPVELFAEIEPDPAFVKAVRAPTGGRVGRIAVEPGVEIRAGAPVGHLVVGRRSTAIKSDGAGTVLRVAAAAGTFVREGDVLATIADRERRLVRFVVPRAFRERARPGLRVSVQIAGDTPRELPIATRDGDEATVILHRPTPEPARTATVTITPDRCR
jgi:biotin carboxyl carrier protein